jgi:hypothetical protein
MYNVRIKRVTKSLFGQVKNTLPKRFSLKNRAKLRKMFPINSKVILLNFFVFFWKTQAYLCLMTKQRILENQKKILNKNIVAIGLGASVFCLVLAGLFYPGGSPFNPQSIGFDWTKNYISNLLENKALNGMNNPARPIAVLGVVLMGISSGWAFVRFAQKLDIRAYSLVIRSAGLALVGCSALLTVPSIHMPVVAVSSTVTLLLLFYVMIVLWRSKLNLLKTLVTATLAFCYGGTYMLFAHTAIDYLPLVQKLVHVLQITLILGLEYYTHEDDFVHMRR